MLAAMLKRLARTTPLGADLRLLLLALGLFTRISALFVAGTMLVAGLFIHAADPFSRRELAFGYAAVAVAVLIAGPGRFSLDKRLFG
jgi:putative oxidoreductase